MTVRTRVEPIDQDIAFIVAEDLSPKARSMMLAAFAREQINEARDTNRKILGRAPLYTVAVDGKQGAPLESVRPDGFVLAEFELFEDVLIWIADQLEIHSPRKTGRYIRGHTAFADGVAIDVGTRAGNRRAPVASEYAFVNIVPYARKIERGQSSQAPDGVYQVLATLARRRFGNIAKISFSYRTAISSQSNTANRGTIVGGRAGDRSEQRNPAIIVRTY